MAIDLEILNRARPSGQAGLDWQHAGARQDRWKLELEKAMLASGAKAAQSRAFAREEQPPSGKADGGSGFGRDLPLSPAAAAAGHKSPGEAHASASQPEPPQRQQFRGEGPQSMRSARASANEQEQEPPQVDDAAADSRTAREVVAAASSRAAHTAGSSALGRPHATAVSLLQSQLSNPANGNPGVLAQAGQRPLQAETAGSALPTATAVLAAPAVPQSRMAIVSAMQQATEAAPAQHAQVAGASEEDARGSAWTRYGATTDAGEYALRHMHIHVGDSGVHAWIRDAALGRAQINAVALAMAGEFQAAGSGLAGLTINGKAVVTTRQAPTEIDADLPAAQGNTASVPDDALPRPSNHREGG